MLKSFVQNKYIQLIFTLTTITASNQALSEVLMEDSFIQADTIFSSEGNVTWNSNGVQLKGGDTAQLEATIEATDVAKMLVSFEGRNRRLDEGEYLEISLYDARTNTLLGSLKNSGQITQNQFVAYRQNLPNLMKIRISLKASSYYESSQLTHIKVQAFSLKEALPGECMHLLPGNHECTFKDRTYKVYVPESGGSLMVMDLHGHQENADVQRSRSGWLDIADSKNLVVIWPEGENGSWNA